MSTVVNARPFQAGDKVRVVNSPHSADRLPNGALGTVTGEVDGYLLWVDTPDHQGYSNTASPRGWALYADEVEAVTE